MPILCFSEHRVLCIKLDYVAISEVKPEKMSASFVINEHKKFVTPICHGCDMRGNPSIFTYLTSVRRNVFYIYLVFYIEMKGLDCILPAVNYIGVKSALSNSGITLFRHVLQVNIFMACTQEMMEISTRRT